ncbi:unnamed protein product, partial [Darwinula stevensoni]
MEMFSSVSSWLGGVMAKKSIPTEEGTVPVASPSEGSNEVNNSESPTSQLSTKGSTDEKNENEDSSPTGSADKESLTSGPDTPQSEKEDHAEGTGIKGDIAEVSNRALQGAKNLGSFLFSAVNKAGKTMSEAGAKLKKTVEENSILGEFNKEQEAFLKEKSHEGGDIGVAPWVGYADEETLKEQILALSSDRRNFVRNPPSGVQFSFNYDTMYPVAQAILVEDKELEKMRFELVPKLISEETFWRNYFYRVSLICQSSELSSMASTNQQEDSASAPSSRTDSMEKDTGDFSPIHTADFASDDYQASSKDIEEVRRSVQQLHTSTKKKTPSKDGVQLSILPQ